MNCLYCGEKLGLFKGGRFCNSKHQELFRQRESEQAIQRLMESFGSAKPATAKAGPPTAPPEPPAEDTRVVTIPETAAPLPEYERQEHRPPDRFPAPEPAFEPVGRTAGPPADGSPPPLAGFILPRDLKTVFRLPVFTRRPEPGSPSAFGPADLDARFINQMLACNATGSESSGFPTIVCISPTDPCPPGAHSDAARTLFVGMPEQMLACQLPIEARKPELQLCELTPSFWQATFAPYSDPPKPSVYTITSAAPDAALSSRPLALRRRVTASRAAFAKYPEFAPASLPPRLTAQPKAVHGSAGQSVLGSAIGRARPALPKWAFFELAAECNPRAARQEAAVKSAESPDAKDWLAALRIAPWSIVFRTGYLPLASESEAAFATHPQESGATPRAVAGTNFHSRSVAMPSRAAEHKHVAARYTETIYGSRPRRARPQPQATLYAIARRMQGSAVGRDSHPLPNSPFQILPVSPVAFTAPPESSAPGIIPADRKPASFELPIESRTHKFPHSTPHVVPLATVASASWHQELEPKIYQVAAAKYRLRPLALSRRAAEPKPVLARYQESVRSSTPQKTLSPLPQIDRYSKPLRAVAATIKRAAPALPNSVFQRPPVFPKPRVQQTLATAAPSTNSPYRKFSSRALPLESRRAAFQIGTRLIAALQSPAFATHRKQSEAKAYNLSETYGLPPVAMSRRAVQPNPAIASYAETVQTSPAHQTGPRPRPARWAIALRAIRRGKLALAGSSFEALPVLLQPPVAPPAAIVQSACVPERVWSPLRINSQLRFPVSKLPLAASGFAPHPKPSAPKLCEFSDETGTARPIVMGRRAVEQQSAPARFPEAAPSRVPGPSARPQVASPAKTQRALAAAAARAKPTLSNSDFLASIISHQELLEPLRAVAAQLHATTAPGLSAPSREPLFMETSSMWHAGACPLETGNSHPPEFALGGSDYPIGCPSRTSRSRRTKPLGLHEFIPWSQLPELCVQPVDPASFLNLQTSVNLASSGRSASAGNDAAGWDSPPVPAGRISVPIQLLPAVTLRRPTGGKYKWSMGTPGAKQSSAATTESLAIGVEELTAVSFEVPASPEKAAAKTGLKWVPMKVPWARML